MTYPNVSRLALVTESLPDSHAGYSWPQTRLPLGVRLTMEQILEVAEDADLRADMFGWLSSGTSNSDQNLSNVNNVNALRQAARGLREISAKLGSNRADPSEVANAIWSPLD